MAHCIRSYKHNEIALACKTLSIHIFTLMEKEVCGHSFSAVRQIQISLQGLFSFVLDT